MTTIAKGQRHNSVTRLATKHEHERLKCHRDGLEHVCTHTTRKLDEKAAHMSEESKAFPHEWPLLACEFNEEAAHASAQSEALPNKSNEYGPH